MKFKWIKTLASLMASVMVFSSGFGMQAATSASQAGMVSTASGNLNVRASESTSAAILSALPKGSYVTLISQTGSWWKVEYGLNQYGYVSSSYITKVNSTPMVVKVSSGNLNVRTGPGTSYSIQGSLPSGRTVLVLSNQNGWSKIIFNGRSTGYVSSAYLTAETASSQMVWPVPTSNRMNQYFVSGSHNGIDIGASVRGVVGEKVVAAYSGTVVYSGVLNGYGYVVYINSVYNGKYIQTRYGHLNGMPIVKAGDTVSAGQQIGNLGNSGTSTGPHLHFEVRIRSSSAESLANAASTPVNPLNYVSIP